MILKNIICLLNIKSGGIKKYNLVMLKTTIGDILASKVNAGDDKRIYFIRDDNIPIYVGQSVDVCERIKMHCGFGSSRTPDLLGEFIHINYPASSKWQVDLLSLDECELIARGYFTENTIFNIDIIEQALILHFGPCLNMFHNQNNPNRKPIPDKYNKNYIPEQINKFDSKKTINQENIYQNENSRNALSIKSLTLMSDNKNIFQNYRQKLSQNTINTHNRSLGVFRDFLFEMESLNSDKKQSTSQIDVYKDISTDPSAWKDITNEIIENFIEWLLRRGFAISSVNLIIIHIRKYANLAFQSGVIDKGNWERIKEIKNINGEKAKAIEKQRANEIIPIPKNPSWKVGSRKIKRSIKITEEKARLLKSFPTDYVIDRRTNLIMCLLLDQGLKSKDIVCLKSELVDLDLGVFHIERSNKGKQSYEMTDDTYNAFNKVFEYHDINVPGPLIVRLLGSKRIKINSKFHQQPIGKRSLYWVINEIGKSVGLNNLTENDCRIYWVNKAMRSGLDLFNIKRTGGWNNIQSVLHHLYEIESTEDNHLSDVNTIS